jgi:hypothetical protein
MNATAENALVKRITVPGHCQDRSNCYSDSVRRRKITFPVLADRSGSFQPWPTYVVSTISRQRRSQKRKLLIFTSLSLSYNFTAFVQGDPSMPLSSSASDLFVWTGCHCRYFKSPERKSLVEFLDGERWTSLRCRTIEED